MEVYQIGPLTKGKIIKRPSAHCRSPYVADVLLDNEIVPIIAHAPALGCCGYAD